MENVQAPYIVTNSNENYQYILKYLNIFGYDISLADEKYDEDRGTIVTDYTGEFGQVNNLPSDLNVLCTDDRELYYSTHEFLKACAKLKNVKYYMMLSKYDLQPGMVIKTKNNRQYILIQFGDHKMIGANSDGWINISDNYTDNLINTVRSNYTIDEVYEIKTGGSIDNILNSKNCEKTDSQYLSLLWKRDESVCSGRVVLTKAEIAQKLNIDNELFTIIN